MYIPRFARSSNYRINQQNTFSKPFHKSFKDLSFKHMIILKITTTQHWFSNFNLTLENSRIILSRIIWPISKIDIPVSSVTRHSNYPYRLEVSNSLRPSSSIVSQLVLDLINQLLRTCRVSKSKNIVIALQRQLINAQESISCDKVNRFTVQDHSILVELLRIESQG